MYLPNVFVRNAVEDELLSGNLFAMDVKLNVAGKRIYQIKDVKN